MSGGAKDRVEQLEKRVALLEDHFRGLRRFVERLAREIPVAEQEK